MLVPIQKKIIKPHVGIITTKKQALLEAEEGVNSWAEKESKTKNKLNKIKESRKLTF